MRMTGSGGSEYDWSAAERDGGEAVLRESENKYRTLFETIDEGFAIYALERDENGNVVDMVYHETNQSYERLTGLKNVTGRRASELLPNLEPSWFERNRRVADSGIAERAEDYVADLDRWYSVHHSRIGDAGSDLVAAVFEDITERKQREEAQQFLLRLSDALRAEPDADAVASRAIRMLSEQLRVDRCCIGLYRLADDYADFTHQVGNERVPPLPHAVRLSDFPDAVRIAFDRTLVIDDIRDADGLSDTDRRSLSALSLRSLVAATLRKGESAPLWFIVVVSASPRHWRPGEVALIEEVTERTWAAVERARAEAALREREEKYRTLFESMTQGYALNELVRDADGRAVDSRLLEINPAFERLTGVPIEEALGRTAREIVPGAADWWFTGIDRIIRTGEPERFEHEVAALGRWYEIHLYPRGGDRFAAIYDDITARKAAEAQSAALLDRERTAREAAEAFLAVMSHELRTPVTSIYGEATLLERDPRRADAAELARDIKEESERLIRIVDDLLVLSGVERGLIRLAPEPVLLRHLLDEVVSDIHHLFPDVAINTGITEAVPPVLADPTALRQVLHNLLSNAAKYAASAGAIEVRGSAENSHVAVEVLDRGPGPGADPEALFGLFYRSPHSSTKASGTGIGLYVARQLVTTMRGTLQARSREGGGAVFRITLPTLYADDADIVGA